MAKAERLPSGNWRVRVQYYDDEGKRHHKSVMGKTEAEALYLAEKESRTLKSEKPEDTELTLRAAANLYIDENINILSPSTVRGYRQFSRNYFPQLFDMAVGRIDNRAVQRAINSDLTHSPKSIKNAVGFVSVVLSRFREDFKLNVKTPKNNRDIRPIPSAEEVGIILKECEGRTCEVAVKLAVYLGMRLSEICGLKFSDIRDGKIYIHTVVVHAEHGFAEKDMTKNASSTRVVSLPPHLAARIEAEPREFEDERVCKGLPTTIYKAFQRLLKRCGLPRYRFHDLRHFNASVMLRLNVPTKYQMARGGWSTDSTLRTVYQHTMTDYAADVDEQIYNFIDSLCDTNM